MVSNSESSRLVHVATRNDEESMFSEDGDCSQCEHPVHQRSAQHLGALAAVGALAAMSLCVALLSWTSVRIGQHRSAVHSSEGLLWIEATTLGTDHLSAQCQKDIAEVYTAFFETDAELEKCVNESSAACLKKVSQAWQQRFKIKQFFPNMCGSAAKMMFCNVTQFLAGSNYSRGSCMPTTCHAKNMVRNGIEEEKDSGLCDGADKCTITVACEGREVITKEIVVALDARTNETNETGPSDEPKSAARTPSGQLLWVLASTLALAVPGVFGTC